MSPSGARRGAGRAGCKGSPAILFRAQRGAYRRLCRWHKCCRQHRRELSQDAHRQHQDVSQAAAARPQRHKEGRHRGSCAQGGHRHGQCVPDAYLRQRQECQHAGTQRRMLARLPFVLMGLSVLPLHLVFHFLHLLEQVGSKDEVVELLVARRYYEVLVALPLLSSVGYEHDVFAYSHH